MNFSKTKKIPLFHNGIIRNFVLKIINILFYYRKIKIMSTSKNSKLANVSNTKPETNLTKEDLKSALIAAQNSAAAKKNETPKPETKTTSKKNETPKPDAKAAAKAAIKAEREAKEAARKAAAKARKDEARKDKANENTEKIKKISTNIQKRNKKIELLRSIKTTKEANMKRRVNVVAELETKFEANETRLATKFQRVKSKKMSQIEKLQENLAKIQNKITNLQNDTTTWENKRENDKKKRKNHFNNILKSRNSMIAKNQRGLISIDKYINSIINVNVKTIDKLKNLKPDAIFNFDYLNVNENAKTPNTNAKTENMTATQTI